MANFDSKRDPWQLSPKALQLHRSVLESFNEEDRAKFTQILTRYQQSKNIQRLAESLHQICNTPQQREEIYPLVRTFIPRKHRERFDFECSRPKSAYGRHYATYSRKQLPKHAYYTTRSLPSDMRNRRSGSSLGFERGTPTPRTPKPARDRKESNARVVALDREVEGESFGFRIRGGSEYNIGLFISSVDEDSVAYKAGLCLGDQILEVNGVDFTNMSHQEAVKVIQQAPILHMLVKSVGKIPGSFKSSSCYRWTDPHGNEVSPPSEYAKENMMNGDKSEMRLLGADDERKVNLFVADGAEIGLKIRGGMEHGLGIFIASVEQNSGADRAGIQVPEQYLADNNRVGDQILDVNGKSFLYITHEEAVQVLKSSQQLVIMLKDVGILPHGKRVYDETKWIRDIETKNSSRPSSSNSSERKSKSMKKIPSFHEPMCTSQLTHHSVLDHSDEILEMKAKQMLPSDDQHAFAFYLNEYRATRLSLTSFLNVLSDLLNTPEKGYLIHEIRSAILPRDLTKFDDWIEKTEHSRLQGNETGNRQARHDRLSLYSYKSSDSSTNSWLGLFENKDEQRMKKNFKHRNEHDALPDPPKDFFDDPLDSRSMKRDSSFDDLPPPPVLDLNSERTPKNVDHFEATRTYGDTTCTEPTTSSRSPKNYSPLNKKSAFAGSLMPTLQTGQLLSPRDKNHTSSKLVPNNSTGRKLNMGDSSRVSKEHLHTTTDNMRINGKLGELGNFDTPEGSIQDDDDGLYASVDYKGFNRTSRDFANVTNGDTVGDRDMRKKHKITRTMDNMQKGMLRDEDVQDGLYASVDSDEPRNVLPNGRNDPKRFSYTNGLVETGQDNNMPVYATVDKSRICLKEKQRTFLDENEFEIPPPIPDRHNLQNESTSDTEENLHSPTHDSKRNRHHLTNTNIIETHASVPLKSNQMNCSNELTKNAAVETTIESFPERLQKFKGKPPLENGDGNAVTPKLKKGKKSKSKSNVVQTDYRQPFVVELTKHSSNLGLSVTGGTDTDSKEIRIKSIKNEDTVAGSCPLLQPGQIILGVDEKSLQNVTSGIAAMAIRQAFHSEKTVFKLILQNDTS